MGKDIVEIPEQVREEEAQRVWKLVLEDIESIRESQKILKSEIADTLGKKRAVITRSTKLENKPELETVVQLYMGINHRIVEIVTEEYDFTSEDNEN